MQPPDIAQYLQDQPMVLASFAKEDLLMALTRITRNMRAIRSRPGWVSADLEPYKQARNALQRFLPKADNNTLTTEEHAELQQELIVQAGYCN